MVKELTLKSGKKIKFEKFGEIKFGKSINNVKQLTKIDSKRITDLYKQAAVNVQKEIDRLELKSELTATDELNKLRLNDLKNSIADNLQEITKQNQSMILNGMKSASNEVTKEMTTWLNSIGISIEKSYANVPQKVIANIVSGQLYGKNWHFSERIWGQYNKSVGDLSRIVAEGIANGKNTFQIAKDLEKYVNPLAAKPWNWNKVYPNVNRQVDYNAQRLARTMITHAYQQTVVETAKENPFVEGVEWRAAFTPTTCEICEALNGQIFPANDVPLDHPNGKCCFIAVINKSPKQIAEELIKWYNGEADADMNERMYRFAESAGFSRSDIDIQKVLKCIKFL